MGATYLLDSHTFLWWITDSARLSPRARAIVTASANRVLGSVARFATLSSRGLAPGRPGTAAAEAGFRVARRTL